MRTNFLRSATVATAIALLPDAAQAASTTCTTSTVCAESVNTYTSSSPVKGGVAIHGEANGGIGVRGTSVSNVGFYGASGSGSFYTPGVEGESTNNSGMDVGGGFGLAALTPNGTAPFVGAVAFGSDVGFAGYTTDSGKSPSSTNSAAGVLGLDLVTSDSGAHDYNAGVLGESSYGTGMLSEANGTPTNGFYSLAPIGVYSVAKAHSGNPFSFAFVGESDGYGLMLDNTGNGASTSINGPGDFVAGGFDQGSAYFYIDYSGSETLSGTLTTSKGTYVRAKGSSGTAVREYSERMTAPQVEDVGEAQLANGRAYVPIDARLADTIDRRTEYHVFVTPEGECNGLFVTQKTPAGFTVRELHGGRSSLAFEYRIVAKPVDDNGARLAALPAETIPKNPARERSLKPQTIAPPLSIEDDLKRRLGPQGYAKALAELRARLAGR